MAKKKQNKKQREYVGMVELRYRTYDGIPTARFVMAFYNTKDELVETFLPGCKPAEVQVVRCKGII